MQETGSQTFFDGKKMITIVQYPKRRVGLTIAMAISLAVHLLAFVGLRYGATIRMALGFSGIEYVDEDYNRAILIDFRKGLKYPSGFLGFVSPTKVKSLEEIKKEGERRARREAERRRRLQEQDKEAAEEKARQEESTRAEPAPPPKPPGETYPGGFGKINTAPIRDQIQRLYDANKAGLLMLPAGKIKVGVTGSIRPDGTLKNYRLIYPSGVPEIDASALAILEAVSESRALGPLHNLTSISLILEVEQIAQLMVVGFTSNEQEARAIVDLANTALLFARVKKAQDLAVMTMLNNLKVSRTGQRVQAVISVPRYTASETLHKTMGK